MYVISVDFDFIHELFFNSCAIPRPMSHSTFVLVKRRGRDCWSRLRIRRSDRSHGLHLPHLFLLPLLLSPLACHPSLFEANRGEDIIASVAAAQPFALLSSPSSPSSRASATCASTQSFHPHFAGSRLGQHHHRRRCATRQRWLRNLLQHHQRAATSKASFAMLDSRRSPTSRARMQADPPARWS